MSKHWGYICKTVYSHPLRVYIGWWIGILNWQSSEDLIQDLDRVAMSQTERKSSQDTSDVELSKKVCIPKHYDQCVMLHLCTCAEQPDKTTQKRFATRATTGKVLSWSKLMSPHDPLAALFD